MVLVAVCLLYCDWLVLLCVRLVVGLLYCFLVFVCDCWLIVLLILVLLCFSLLFLGGYAVVGLFRVCSCC